MISRAENEVDSLEIVVETEANKASRTLTSVEKKALKVADALDKCAKSAHGLDFTGVAGLSELTNISKMFHEIQKEKKAVNNGEVRIRTNRSDLKYPAKELKELQKQFKDSKLDIDFSKMGSEELRKEIKKNESAYNRLKQSMSDKITLAGTDALGGKSWYKDVMKLNQYENAANDAAKAIGRLEKNKLDFTIERSNDGISDIADEVDGAEAEIKSASQNISESFHEISSSAEKARKEITSVGSEAQKIEKQSFAKGVLDAFRMDEKGNVPNIKNLKNVFGESMSGSAGKILDFFKIDDSGAITGINRIKEKLIELKNISRKSTQIDTPDTSGIDAIIGRLQQEITRTKELILELASSSTAKPDSIDEEMKSLSDLERELKKYERLKKSMNAGNIKSEVFEYALEPADENSSTEAVFSEVEVTQEGITKGSFEEMRYKRPGDYKYTVYQLKGESKDVIYDGSVYEVTVRVVNTQEGGLAAEVWAVKDQSDQKTDEIKFINQYKETTTATTEAINNTIHHTTTNTITESSIGTSSPKTGDKSNVMLWGGIAILSGLCVFFFLFEGKRRKTEE